MTDPWLIVQNEDGTIKSYDTMDDESLAIVQALVANHAGHGGIFFVPECEVCRHFFGATGEKWHDDSARRQHREFMDREAPA